MATEGLWAGLVTTDRSALHREGNPSEVDSTLVVVRAGQGEPVFNLDGPAAG